MGGLSKSRIAKFNRQDPEIRRHGPKRRKTIIHETMLEVLRSEFMDEWRSSQEIAELVNMSVSKYWSPVTSNVVASRMPRYIIPCKLDTRTKFEASGRRYWRKIK